MLEDMIVAVDALSELEISFADFPSLTESTTVKCIGQNKVELAFPPGTCSTLKSVFGGEPLRLIPALLTLGVNEKQTIAIDSSLEQYVNEQGFVAIRNYFEAVRTR